MVVLTLTLMLQLMELTVVLSSAIQEVVAAVLSGRR